MKNTENAIAIIRNVLLAKSKQIYPALKVELVDSGKMTNLDIQKIISEQTKLEDIKVEVLVWLYKVIAKCYDVAPIGQFFEEAEIKNSETFLAKKYQNSYPVKLKVLDVLPPHNDFLITLSAQEISAMKTGGLISIRGDMQRESVITNYGGVFVSAVSYTDNRAREIGSLMANHDYFPNTLRWHIVANGEEDWEFNENSMELTINKGEIAEIDGQHRDRGVEYAIDSNPATMLRLPIIITIGNVAVGQKIINQEEKRAPLNKRVVRTYEDTNAVDIVKTIMASNDLDRTYKIVNTIQGILAGAGFVLQDVLISAVEKCYNTNEMTKKQCKKLSLWLIEYLNELADIFHEDFKNYRSVSKKTWSVSPYTFAGYIYLSSKLYGKDKWEDLLREYLDKIDFSINALPWKHTTSKKEANVVKLFSEVVTNDK